MDRTTTANIAQTCTPLRNKRKMTIHSRVPQDYHSTLHDRAAVQSSPAYRLACISLLSFSMEPCLLKTLAVKL